VIVKILGVKGEKGGVVGVGEVGGIGVCQLVPEGNGFFGGDRV